MGKDFFENSWEAKNSHPGPEAHSWVLLQSIHPMGLEKPQPSFTLPGLYLALSALISVAPCTWFPTPWGQLVTAALCGHSSAPLSQQPGWSGSHQVATAGVSHCQARR